LWPLKAQHAGVVIVHDLHMNLIADNDGARAYRVHCLRACSAHGTPNMQQNGIQAAARMPWRPPWASRTQPAVARHAEPRYITNTGSTQTQKKLRLLRQMPYAGSPW
jgi:hypothetical protein